MYDLNSTQERKNPQAVVRAFRTAFPDSKDVKLVVKIHNADKNPEDFAALQESLRDVPGAILINETLSHGELRALQGACDCFVSLHRSEGFGMGLAECMLLGKPVIATNWSGNLEFMNAENSCLVDYKLVEITQTCGPYKKGQKWAAPDETHAASWMRKIVEDTGLRERISRAAKARIEKDFSRARIGELYERRLRTLFHWV
jgi:glycosyltransferase involved in cell wall biosynthesis